MFTPTARQVLNGTSTLCFILLALIAMACDNSAIVSGPEFADLKKLRGGEYDLVKKEDLVQLKREAELGRSVGRYQQYSRGYRTWRLDTATGNTCLLLATDSDWKKPDTQASSCALVP
jgi:hypothetical protein